MSTQSPALDRAKIEAVFEATRKLTFSCLTADEHRDLIRAVAEAISRAAPSGSDMALVPREKIEQIRIIANKAAKHRGEQPPPEFFHELIGGIAAEMLAAAPPAPLTPSPLLVNVHPDGRVTYLDGRPVPLAATQPQGDR